MFPDGSDAAGRRYASGYLRMRRGSRPRGRSALRVVSFHPIFAKPSVRPSTEWILTTGFWFGRGDPKAHEISTARDPIELARYSCKV